MRCVERMQRELCCTSCQVDGRCRDDSLRARRLLPLPSALACPSIPITFSSSLCGAAAAARCTSCKASSAEERVVLSRSWLCKECGTEPAIEVGIAASARGTELEPEIPSREPPAAVLVPGASVDRIRPRRADRNVVLWPIRTVACACTSLA